jgi:hypothetical protein
MYQVPVEDIIKEWESQKAKHEKELQKALETATDLKSKGVDDACISGKIAHAQRNIQMLTLQLKYLGDLTPRWLSYHEMAELFSTNLQFFNNIGSSPVTGTGGSY